MGANTSRPGGGSSSNNNGAAPHLKARDLVDYGSVLPNGLYATAQQDYDLRTVRNLILSRKLSPFYKGLADAPEPVVFAPDKHLPVPQASLSMSSISASKSTTMRPRSASNTHPGDPMARNYADQQRKLREKMLYNDVVECPICFLFYPSNINFSRCCNQPICTECFLAIKPSPGTASATCPFCMQENFGVIYSPPSWLLEKTHEKLKDNFARHTTSGIVSAEARPRREAIPHTDPNVVLVEHVRPNHNKPLAVPGGRRTSSPSSRASMFRSNSPRTFMTRPGRSASAAAHNSYLSQMDLDLEQWMVMEAIRISLAEYEARENAAQRDDQEDDDNQPLYHTAQRHGYQQNQETTPDITVSPSPPNVGPISRPESLYEPSEDEEVLQNDSNVSIDTNNTSSNNSSSSSSSSSSGNDNNKNHPTRQPVSVDKRDTHSAPSTSVLY